MVLISFANYICSRIVILAVVILATLFKIIQHLLVHSFYSIYSFFFVVHLPPT
jgi:hypothetical protein